MGFDMPIRLDAASSSEGSFLGLTEDSELIQIIGAFGEKNNKLHRAIEREIKNHEKAVRANLAKDDDWKSVSDHVTVSFSGGNLTYHVNGDDDVMSRFNELEYGSPTKAASGVMRKLALESDEAVDKIINNAMKVVFG